MNKRHIYQTLLPLILYLLTSCGQKNNNASNHEFLNLDFSQINNGKPTHWFWGDIGYDLQLESKYGESAIEMKSNDPKDGEFGMILNYIPIELVRGKTVKIDAWIQTTDVTDGYAGLWCGVNKSWGPQSPDEWQKEGLSGSNRPQLKSVQIEIEESANEFNFGGIFNGKGQATFFQFSVYIDGEKYIDTQTEELTEKQKAWLRDNVHSLKTTDPYATENDDDLKILDSLIGDSKVVALGEVTHGAKEIFDMKHRIVRYLAKNKGHNVFSIEANLPESYAINENYIVNGKENANEHLASLYFWTWQTQEVKNMLEWMKDYKQEGGKIQFTGFDMQASEGALKNIEEAFAHDTSIKNTLKEVGRGIEIFREEVRKSQGTKINEERRQALLKTLAEISSLIEHGNSKDKGWLQMNLNILRQSLHNSLEGRDKYMAENFLWIMNQNPNSKFSIWAHNVHISKEKPWMGSYLAEAIGKDYLTIGFTFYEGNYTAMGHKRLNTYDAQTAYLGTLESYLNSIDEPLFIIDLRKAKADQSPEAKWITSQLKYRTTGAVQIDEEFGVFNIDNFDLMIFINRASASELLQ